MHRPKLTMRPELAFKRTQRFDLLWNFRRNNRRHVYLALGDSDDLGGLLSYFKRQFDLTAVVVNVTPRTTDAAIRMALSQHGCCIFYVRGLIPVGMRSVRQFLEQHKYAPALLTSVNKVYRFNDPSTIYALAA